MYAYVTVQPFNYIAPFVSLTYHWSVSLGFRQSESRETQVTDAHYCNLVRLLTPLWTPRMTQRTELWARLSHAPPLARSMTILGQQLCAGWQRIWIRWPSIVTTIPLMSTWLDLCGFVTDVVQMSRSFRRPKRVNAHTHRTKHNIFLLFRVWVYFLTQQVMVVNDEDPIWMHRFPFGICTILNQLYN